MQESQPSVAVEVVSPYPAIRMIWQHRVDKADLGQAFKTITEMLDASETPLYIMVDLRANPNFPLTETISGALFGPFRHSMLAEWLVIGASSVARSIGGILSNATGRSNIHWFKTEAEALAYLENAANDVA